MQPLQSDDPSHLGNYRLLARLGAGGMGQVYLARSPGGRTVAIKVVRAELAAEEGFRARFRREVSAARQVSGAYTAPVVNADPDAVVPWLATAYVAGPSLVDAVASHGPLPEPTVRALAAGLAEALRAVHGAGIVHRDLKPSNVLLALDGPRLIDFGISRAADDTSITRTGLVVGSPGYMSPEQANGAEIGPPSDFFSLASVLVFAATAQGPFGGGSAPSLLYRIVHTPPDLGSVPAYLRPIVEPYLDKDPARRPGGRELLDLAVPDGQTTEVLTRSGWLPPAITYAIAERSAALLDLDASGSPGGASAASRPAPSAPPPPPSYAPTLPPPSAPPSVPAPAASPPPRQPFLAPSGQEYPPPQLPRPPQSPFVHEQPTPAGAFPPGGPAVAPSYGPPFGPPLGPPSYGPPPGGAGGPGGPNGPDSPNRRALLIGGAAVSVAAVGGVTAWLLTKSDGGNGGDKTDTAGGSSSKSPSQQPQGDSGASPSASGPRPLLKLGFQGGLTGPNAQLGINMQNGAVLAVKQADERGDLPFRVELVASDDEASETKSAMAAQKLIDDDDVVAVVGPVFSGPTKAAGALYENAGLAAVTPSATNPVLTTFKYTFFNRAATNDSAQGAEIAAYLKNLGVSSVFLMGDQTEYATGLLDAARAALGAGVQVTSGDVPKGTPDYAAAAAQVKNSGAQAVVYGGYYQEAAPLAVKLAETGFTGHRIAPDGVADPQFVKLAGAASEGWYLTVGAVDPVAAPELRDFAAAYQAMFKTPPRTYSAEAFDVVNLVIEAAKSLGSRAPTRSAMLGAVRSVRYKTPLREYAFDRSTGEFAGTGGIYVYQVKNQAITYLGNIHKLITS
ncbi:bifunctional serine/threonine-protein kinase/ABC transporter substrate-binding protein [Streptomycetaceae bacterium NBC_01309]